MATLTRTLRPARVTPRLFCAGAIAALCLGLPGSPVAGAVKPETITEASIRAHMEFLASDAMNGRGSGTHDEWVAASYIGSQMRRWGIEPLGDNGGFVQQIETSRLQSAAPPVLVVPGARFAGGKDLTVQALSRGVSSGLLYHYKPNAPAPRDAFVIVPSGATPAATDIAAAAGVISPQVAAPAAGRGARGGGPGAPIWRLTLAKDAYDNVAAMADGTPVSIEADVKPGSTWNAIGQLKGSDPKMADDVILLTAHLDHLGNRGTGPDTIYNGADDDASGSTAVLELAEAIVKGPRPKRTIVFAWFGSEEAGGFGARHFLDSPPMPLERIVANLEFEMLGRPDEKVPAAHVVADRLRAVGPRASPGQGGRAARAGSASRSELLPAIRQHSARPQRDRRADGVELQSAHRLPSCVRRPVAHRLRAHDRVDSVDVRAGAVARQLDVQADVGAGPVPGAVR